MNYAVNPLNFIKIVFVCLKKKKKNDLLKKMWCVNKTETAVRRHLRQINKI